jgi:hypothetical protein
MAPSAEYYQGHLASIDTGGFVIEKSDKKLLLWQEAQIPKRKNAYFVQLDAGGNEYYGMIIVPQRRLGEGSLEIPVMNTFMDPEYAKIADKNKTTMGDVNSASAIYEKLGLTMKTKYNRCYTFSYETVSNGKPYMLITIYRFLYGETGDEEKIREYPADLSPQELSSRLALSAMGLATVMEEDLRPISISPKPFSLIFSESQTANDVILFTSTSSA